MNAIVLTRFREFPGALFGIRNRTAIAVLRTRIRGPGDVDCTNRALRSITGLDMTEEYSAALSGRDDTHWAHVAIGWYFTIHCAQRVPVFPQAFLIDSVNGDDGESVTHTVALPHMPGVSKDILQWVTANIGRSSSIPASDLEKSYVGLVGRVARFSLGGTNGIHFARAAFRLGIQYRVLPLNVLSIGTGKGNRWLQSSVSEETSHLGMMLAASKRATNHVLRSRGLPVPLQTTVISLDHCRQVAANYGFPVVIKPDNQEQGRGVSSGVRSDEQLTRAYREATPFSGEKGWAVLEKHHEGIDIRFTVVRGRVYKVFSRHAGCVIGEGHSTIRELVEREQQQSRMQRLYRQYGRYLLDLDDEAMLMLEEQGLSPDFVPDRGHVVPLRWKNNVSAGGTQALIPLAEIHPDNIDLAIHASQVLRLDIAGVDLIISDPGLSWRDAGGVIIEVNSMPQIGISLAPEVYEKALLRILRHDPHIPVHLLLLDQEKKGVSTERLLFHAQSIHANCVVSRDGVWLNAQRQPVTYRTAFEACVGSLQDTRVHAALCVISADEVVSSGLPATRFSSVSDSGVLGLKCNNTLKEREVLLHSALYLK